MLYSTVKTIIYLLKISLKSNTMVFLHIPQSFTEEEIMLQAKYDKLKKKKKAIQVMKTPKQEIERATPVKKPQIDGRDAREIAKKLLKSGAIAAIKKTPKREEMSGFKRPRGSTGRKSESLTLSGYQPFAGNREESRPARNMYDTISTHEREPSPLPEPVQKLPKKTGRTVFVKCHQITEARIQNTFSEYGEITDIKVDTGKNQGFVTFKTPQAAESCISALNGTVFYEYQLSVSYAKRQPTHFSSPGNKPENKEDPSRELVIYDDVFF